MDPSNSDVATNYINNILKGGTVLSLKSLVQEIKDDYDNPCDYLLKYCKSVYELQEFLKDYSYLYIVENSKVALQSDELETGQENADKFFVEKLKEFKKPVDFLLLRKCVDGAPSGVKCFMETFYPDEKDLKRFLQKRPHIFVLSSDNTVHLIEEVSVNFFKKRLKVSGDGLRITSLRGSLGQAPEHIRKYINSVYPGNEFRNLLENNSDIFNVNNNDQVYLVK